MNGLSSDLKAGARALRKSPAVAAIAILSLALGIAANSTIFSIMNALVLKPLPFSEPERIAVLWQNRLESPQEVDDVAPANFVDWRQQNRSFAELAAFSGATYDLTDDGRPQEVKGMTVTPGFFEVLGMAPILGRPFVADDAVAGRNDIAMISSGLWSRRFASDPAIVGKRIRLNGTLHTIVGVARPGWYLGSDTDVWTPLAWSPTDLNRENHYLSVIGRLRPGSTFGQAQGDMDEIARRLASTFPTENAGYGALVKPIGEVFPDKSDTRILGILMAAVALVLLIACANVANLQLARANQRLGETAIRCALGATKLRIVRQHLIESTILGMAGGLVGLGLCWIGLRLLGSSVALSGYWNAITLDRGVVLFTFAVSVLSAILFGLAPALRASSTNLNAMLREDSRSTSRGSASRRIGRILVIAEITLAIVVLAIGADFVRGFARLRNVNPGFDASSLVTARVTLRKPELAQTQFSESQTVTRTFDAMAERIAALPGVTGVAYMTELPRSVSNPRTRFALSEQRNALGGEAPIASWRAVSAGFFSMMHTAVIAGREFDSRDRFGADLSIVINQSLARRLFDGQEAIGKQLFIFDAPRTVVGVVGDAMLDRGTDPTPCIYLPHAQSPRLSMSFLVRTGGNAAGLLGSVQDAVQQVDHDQPVTALMTYEQHVEMQFAGRRLVNGLLLAFCLLALTLAAIGLYGVISYVVSQRRGEFAVRMAVGATSARVFQLVLTEALALTAAGIALAVFGLVAGRHLLEQQLGQLGHSEWSTTTAVVALIVAVSIVGSLFPALRAARTQPSAALRQ